MAQPRVIEDGTLADLEVELVVVVVVETTGPAEGVHHHPGLTIEDREVRVAQGLREDVHVHQEAFQDEEEAQYQVVQAPHHHHLGGNHQVEPAKEDDTVGLRLKIQISW